MPSKVRFLGLLLSMLAVSFLVSVGTAQEKKSASSSTKVVQKRAYKGRLPNGWPKLGISGEQRKEIYAAQIAARAKRVALEKQIEQIRRALDKEIRVVLTDEQLEKLAEMEAESKKTLEERRKARESKNSK